MKSCLISHNYRFVVGLFLFILCGCVSLQAPLMEQRVGALAVPPKSDWNITASSAEKTQFAPQFAADNNPQTRWSSNFSDPQWLQIDLGRPAQICGMVIKWETAYARQYRVEVSPDANHWQPVAAINNGDGRTDYIFFPLTTTKFVRIFGTERGTGWGYSIWELDLIGAESRPKILQADLKKELPGSPIILDSSDTTVWHTPSLPFEFVLDLKKPLPVGGIRLNWGTNYPLTAKIFCSADARNWTECGEFDDGKGKFDMVIFPARTCRYYKVSLTAPAGIPVDITELLLRGPDEDASPLALYRVAAEKSPYLYPAYLRQIQTFWTAVGPAGHPQEAILDEFGTVEPHKDSPATYLYLIADDGVSPLSEMPARHYGLVGQSYPLPYLVASDDEIEVRISAVPWQDSQAAATLVKYDFANRTAHIITGKIALVVRPLQVNPPWQFGGWAGIEKLALRRSEAFGTVAVNGNPYLTIWPVWDEARLQQFHNGDVAEHLPGGGSKAAVIEQADASGMLSAALYYHYSLEPMQELHLVAAFALEETSPDAAAILTTGSGEVLSPYDAFDLTLHLQAEAWRQRLSGFSLELPLVAAVQAARAQASYLVVNQDGPALQPGPRNYNRSWMRDGSLMAAALLRMGITNPVRSFIEWYTERVQPDGWVPPILNSDGTINKGFGWDNEYDSQGEYAYLVMEYFRFTGDRSMVEKCYPALKRAAHYIESLLNRTRPPDYMRESKFPERFRGILPPSISHEGYATPAHSYWDNFWALRGLKDYRAAAELLEDHPEAEWAQQQYQMLRSALSNSIKATMATAGIDYIPASADHADFDPTSTSIAFFPCDEEDILPADAVKRTYERYCHGFDERIAAGWKGSYTPYETRNINALCLLGMKEQAHRLLRFLLAGRNPYGWNAFAEVVHGDARRGSYIGDLPHTWVGAGFAMSVRNLAAMEKRDQLFLMAGIPAEWLQRAGGISTDRLPTAFGTLSFKAHLQGYTLKMTFSNTLKPPGGVVLCWPLEKPSQVIVDGQEWTNFDERFCYLPQTPQELTAYW